MKSEKITRTNQRGDVNSTGHFVVKSKFYNDLHDDVEFLYPVSNQIFSGTINLEKALTHYNNYTVTTNIVISPSATKIYSAAAEIRLIADGSHTPDLTAFTKSSGSADWNTTAGKIHKTVFYYDGTEVFYSHTILN